MEYFEIEKENIKGNINKNKNKKRNKNNIIKYLLLIPVFIILILFITYNNSKSNKSYYSKENKSNDKKLQEGQNNNINENKYNIESIKQNPYLHTEYILNLFKNSKNLDLTKFNKNLNNIKQKIYYIINNKKENEDLYKILSTIYGAFLADSMGSFCEFKSFNKNNHLSIFNPNSYSIFKPGQVTDDSEMAMSQAYAIMDTGDYETLNEHLLFYYYIIWYHSHPLDIGITTKNALNTLNLNEININEDIFTEKIKNIIKEKNYASLANGLLMRISPLLSWFYMTNKNYIKQILGSKSSEKYYEIYIKIYNQIEKDSKLTHPNRENIVSGSIFIFMGLFALEQNYSGKEILENIKILFEHNDFNMKKEEKILKNHFNNFLNDFGKDGFNKDNYFKDLTNSMGYYLHAYRLTLYYLYNFETMKKVIDIKNIYNNIMFDICDFGGDTDTNAAIVGMIMGPLIGLENFSNKYFETFLNYYSDKRLIYTNCFMYFYAKYLIDITKDSNIPNNKINYNFFNMINDMINNEL